MDFNLVPFLNKLTSCDKSVSYLQIISVDMETDRVHVRVKPHVDVDFSSIYGNWSLTDYYYSSQEVCNKLHLSNLLLSRICSSCSCEQSGNGRYTIFVIPYFNTVFLIRCVYSQN